MKSGAALPCPKAELESDYPRRWCRRSEPLPCYYVIGEVDRAESKGPSAVDIRSGYSPTRDIPV